ncbi:hypothetical protein BC829DRAFT_390814 [Chytridium lagenaria]|nr:hypothetical protein BC829DRAFT_390814 [Chytridium lagenaria]
MNTSFSAPLDDETTLFSSSVFDIDFFSTPPSPFSSISSTATSLRFRFHACDTDDMADAWLNIQPLCLDIDNSEPSITTTTTQQPPTTSIPTTASTSISSIDISLDPEFATIFSPIPFDFPLSTPFNPAITISTGPYTPTPPIILPSSPTEHPSASPQPSPSLQPSPSTLHRTQTPPQIAKRPTVKSGTLIGRRRGRPPKQPRQPAPGGFVNVVFDQFCGDGETPYHREVLIDADALPKSDEEQ